MNLIGNLAMMRVLQVAARPPRLAALTLLTPRARLLQAVDLINSAEERLRTFVRMEQANGSMNVTLPWWAAMQAMTRLIGALEQISGLPANLIIMNFRAFVNADNQLRGITVQLASLSRASEPAGSQSITLPSADFAQMLDAISLGRTAINGIVAALPRSFSA